jgi:hypothetical protein
MHTSHQKHTPRPQSDLLDRHTKHEVESLEEDDCRAAPASTDDCTNHAVQFYGCKGRQHLLHHLLHNTGAARHTATAVMHLHHCRYTFAVPAMPAHFHYAVTAVQPHTAHFQTAATAIQPRTAEVINGLRWVPLAWQHAGS